MYGLAIYLADMAQKSHRYVAGEEEHRRACDGSWRPRAGFAPAGAAATVTVRRGDGRGGLAPLGLTTGGGVTTVTKVADGSSAAVAGVRVGQDIVEVAGRRITGPGDLKAAFAAAGAEFEMRLETRADGEWERARGTACTVYTMLRCQTNLGSPYLIEGSLLRGDAMHDVCRPTDPSDFLDHCPEEWDHRRGMTAYFAKGQGYATKAGHQVMNNEYIVFHPYQVWPRYVVKYTLE